MKTCLFLLSARDRLGVNNQKIKPEGFMEKRVLEVAQ